MNSHDYDTGGAAIAYSYAPTRPRQIVEVRIKLSAVGGAAEDLTIVHNSALGATYDHTLVSQDMAAIADVVYKPDEGYHDMALGDSLDIAYANSNSRTWTVEVIHR